MPKDNIVSDNLPIYFIWFGSDIPSEYFGNLKDAADENKSRDIILVYSEKHLLKDNRKNIDSMESMSFDDIKAGIDKKRNGNTRNLWKIDVYDMKLDEQVDVWIYDLLNKIFTTKFSINNEEKKSFKYCAASDIIRLPLLNITGGIYFDVDTEITGEIGNIESKKGFNFYFDEKNNFLCNFFSKSAEKSSILNQIIPQHISKLFNMYFTNGFKATCPGSMICEFITQSNTKSNEFVFSDFNCKLPSTVKLKIEQGKGYDKDYNNPRDLKKLGLDQQSDISSK